MNWKIKALIITIVVLSAALPFGSAQELDSDAMEATFYVEFNRVIREEFGARALARNAILDEVAQEIAGQVGCTENRVEFDVKASVEALGYNSYPEDNEVRTTRLPLLPIVNQRPIEEMAIFYTADVFETNINQPGRFYREIGVGVAPCIVDLGSDAVGSTQQYGLFVILGSQPDVIPVIIENGESQLTAASVPLTVEISVHQENSRQRPDIFGRGETIRLSNEPLDDSVEAIRFEDNIEWELENCGENTVFYELTDAEGVTVEGSTSVEVVCE